MNLSRLKRLIRLLGLLQAGKGHNADALAKAVGVSRRTIFRDLDVLRAAGVPLMLDDDFGVYRIPANYFLPPTNFTPEEALAVMVLCHELGSGTRMPFREAAESAALKLECTMPAQLRDHIRDTTSAVHMNSSPGSRLASHLPVYRQLLACIASRRAVQIEYDSLADKALLRLKLSPYRLLFSRHSWYVIGRSAMHREIRTFHVGRIRTLTMLDDRFQMPRNFTIAGYLRNAWHMIPGDQDHDVTVRFAPKVARNVADVLWHPTQRVVSRADGSLDYHVRVSGLDEISWSILGYGDQAEVIKPAELRDSISRHAHRMIALYNGHA